MVSRPPPLLGLVGEGLLAALPTCPDTLLQVLAYLCLGILNNMKVLLALLFLCSGIPSSRLLRPPALFPEADMVAYPLRGLWDSSPFAPPWISVGPYRVVTPPPPPRMTTGEASPIVLRSFACHCGSPLAALDLKRMLSSECP